MTNQKAKLGDPLTKTELVHLRLLADGYKAPGAAKELWVSVPTVKFHRSSIFIKLGAKTGSHAVAIAFRKGILEL